MTGRNRLALALGARHRPDRRVAGDDRQGHVPMRARQTHLARWRGNCLATLGAHEAADDLISVLSGNQTLASKRAETSLRVDLALALRKRGDIAESTQQAARAAELAGRTGSARQRNGIAKLLA